MTILYQGSEDGDWLVKHSAWNNIGYRGDPYSRVSYRADDGTNSWVVLFAPDPITDTFACGYYFFFGDGATGGAGVGNICCELQDDTGQGWIALIGTNTNGQYNIGLWNGASYDIVGACNLNNIGDGGWHNFVVDGIGTSGGDILYQLEGFTLAHFTGVDLTAVPNLQFAKVAGHGGRTDMSEYALADETLVGHRTKVVGAESNGAETDGTGNYTDINETGLDTSAFWALPTAGDARSVKASARALTNPQFKGVTVTGTLMRVDAVGPQNAKPFLRIGGVNYYGDTVALDTGWKNFQYTWAQNPATTADWTASDVNSAAMEWGWEAVA